MNISCAEWSLSLQIFNLVKIIIVTGECEYVEWWGIFIPVIHHIAFMQAIMSIALTHYDLFQFTDWISSSYIG